jgi:hypothetical protein
VPIEATFPGVGFHILKLVFMSFYVFLKVVGALRFFFLRDRIKIQNEVFQMDVDLLGEVTIHLVPNFSGRTQDFQRK